MPWRPKAWVRPHRGGGAYLSLIAYRRQAERGSCEDKTLRGVSGGDSVSSNSKISKPAANSSVTDWLGLSHFSRNQRGSAKRQKIVSFSLRFRRTPSVRCCERL